MSKRHLSGDFKNILNSISSPFSRCSAFHLHSCIMAPKSTLRGGDKSPQQMRNITSRPRLTHFLCLPLVNSTSIPQLVSSLAEFRDSIPLVPPPVSALVAASAQLPHTPLFPNGALRPLGTLHLTLGVMSLPTKERLEEALAFFHSLDLESMLRDVEAQARAVTAGESGISNAIAADTAPQPLIIDLKSLHALPKARAATILHAQPVDNTSRLYPFCVSLRNKFIEAGFIEQEMIKNSPRSKNQAGRISGNKVPADGSDSEGLEGGHGDNDDKNSNIGAASLSTQAEAPSLPSDRNARKPRPLLLHATIANTVYLPCRKQRNGKRKEPFKFDARPLLMEFGDYEFPNTNLDSWDQECAYGKNHALSLEVGGEGEGKEDEVLEIQKESKRERREKGPFVWARNIPIDRVCICEMGAKPVPDNCANGGQLLGEAYVSIAEESLVFAPQVTGDGDGDNGDRSDDGGVRLR
ncbi:nitrositive-stress induced transcript [Histoplasma ohiense]|nr:nitrositive-stress induced transcript [Histoplasma ohiense (nom. inval.)]